MYKLVTKFNNQNPDNGLWAENKEKLRAIASPGIQLLSFRDLFLYFFLGTYGTGCAVWPLLVRVDK
jgi:hypothetical protein